MRAYRALLAHPGVGRLVVAALVSRTTVPVLSLALLLAAQDRYGSYALGGSAVGAYTVAFALSVPVTGRLVDRLGQRPVLLSCLAVNVVAYTVLLIALERGEQAGVLLAAAALLGLSLPPLGPVIRGGWRVLVPPAGLRTAYALDAVLNEVAQIGAPLLVALLVTGLPPHLVLAVAGVGTAVSVVLVSVGPPARRAGREEPTGGRLGALAAAPVRAVLGTVLLGSAAAGSLVVAVTAAAGGGSAGLLLGVLGVGAVLSGLRYGSRDRAGRRRRQLAALHLGAAALLLAAGVAPAPVVLGLVLFPLGLVSGPRDALTQLLLGDAAPPGRRTETFGWFSTVTWVGYGVGAAVAGPLADRAFAAAALASALAAAAALLVHDRLPSRT